MKTKLIQSIVMSLLIASSPIFLQSAFAQQVEVEPNNTESTINLLNVPGILVGSLNGSENRDRKDYFRFTVPKTSIYRFTLDDDSDTADLDIYLATSFERLGFGGFAADGDEYGSNPEQITESLVRGQEYFIEIQIENDFSSNYTLTIVEFSGNYTYYIPYFKAGNGFWTGLGLTNRNLEVPTSLQVKVYGVSGDLLSTENKTILPHGQDSFVVATQLNSSGWIQIDSNQPMSGLAFLGSWRTPLLMADIPFSSDLSSCMIVPHIAQDSSWDTTILICNPNNETVSVTLKYVDKSGVEQGIKNYTILANGCGEYLLSTVFSNKIPLGGSVEINSSNGIAAFALYSDKKNGGTYYAGINADSCE